MRAQHLTDARGLREYRMTFDSMADLAHHCRTATITPCFAGKYGGPASMRDDDDRDFDQGTRGPRAFDDALDLAESGWTGADERINALTGALTGHVCSLIERPRWTADVTGEALDIGAALSGEPEHWRSLAWEIAEGAGRRIYRVIVPIGGHCMISGDAYTYAGAAACAAVAAIEAAGHGAEVWAYQAADEGSNRVSQRVLVKQAEFPLDLPRLAFVLAHPAFHRRLIFRTLETSPESYSSGMIYGYGHPSYHYLTEATEPTDFLLPTAAAVHDFVQAGGAAERLIDWLLTRLEAAGLVRPGGPRPTPGQPAPRRRGRRY